MVEQWNCVVEQSNSAGGTVERLWWNSVVEHWNSDSGTVLWNSETLMVEQCLWNSETVIVEQCGGTLEQ